MNQKNMYVPQSVSKRIGTECEMKYVVIQVVGQGQGHRIDSGANGSMCSVLTTAEEMSQADSQHGQNYLSVLAMLFEQLI